MPNRILRDWTDSEKVNTISALAERFFVRLIMKVDDYGRYTAHVKLLKSTLFPFLTDEIREADISRWMAECQKAGLILFYEVESKPYLQVENFKQTLRQKNEKYPPPDARDVNATHLHSISISDANTKRNETNPKRIRNEGEDATHEKKISKEIFKPPTLEEFENYFLENHYPRELAIRAWKGYDAANWHDSQNNKIRNWKQKCQHVWFKNNQNQNANTTATSDKIGRNTRTEIESFLNFGASLDKMAKAGQDDSLSLDAG